MIINIVSVTSTRQCCQHTACDYVPHQSVTHYGLRCFSQTRHSLRAVLSAANQHTTSVLSSMLSTSQLTGHAASSCTPKAAVQGFWYIHLRLHAWVITLVFEVAGSHINQADLRQLASDLLDALALVPLGWRENVELTETCCHRCCCRTLFRCILSKRCHTRDGSNC